MFSGIQLWVYLAAAAAVPLTSFDGVTDNTNNLNATPLELDKRWKTVLDSFWRSAPDKYFAGDRKGNEKAIPLSTNGTRRPKSSRFLNGFFAKNDRGRGETNNRTSRVRHATDRAKEAIDNDNATVGATDDGLRRTVFGAEDECVSANNGRPCVCYTADLLDSIGERSSNEPKTVTDNGTTTSAFRCPSYKPVPVSFVVTPAATAVIDETIVVVNVTKDEERVTNAGGNDGTATAPVRTEVDFDYVVDYRLETSDNDHFAVHYGLVGSDVKIRCSIDGAHSNNTNAVFNWDYKRDRKRESKSTISGTDTNNLLILGLDPRDTKNYTCSPDASKVNKSRKNRPYTHYVIAVEKPIYEIRGTAFYKTTDNSGCTIEIINNVRKQMPSRIRSVMCPEGPSRYACNVDVVASKCVENEVGTLEIEYSVTLNEKARYLTQLRTDERSRDVLYYQRLLARISNVMVQNLNKTLKVQIMSKMSLIDTRFEPDYERMQIKKYVSCSPGFGIREVFCGACPPHHYSPDKTVECLKCPKGFHQPIAGSEECVKCPTPFSSGCYMREAPYIIYFVAGLICLKVFVFFVVFCLCCFREGYETNITLTRKKIRKIFKKPEEYSLLSKEKSYMSD